MLPDRLTQLLTAYVDGELSNRQRKSVQRLLQRSPEARELYHQLKGDSSLLSLLPRLRPSTDISCEVMQTIAVQGIKPKRPAVKTAPSYVATVAGLAAAAAVLLMVGAASYFFVTFEQSGKPGTPFVQVKKLTPLSAPGTTLPERVTPNEPNAPMPEQPPSETPETVKTTKPETPQTPQKEYVKTQPNGPELPPDDGQYRISRPEDVQAVPSSPDSKTKETFLVVKPRLLPLALRDLDQAKPMQQLQDELNKDNAFRIELFCPDRTRAVERLQSAFKAHGITFRIDPETQTRLKQRQKVNFALFADDLMPNELAQILLKLGGDDKAAAAKDPRDGQFAVKGLLKPLVAADQKELAHLLGVAPAQILPPKRKAPLGVDIRKPLSDATASQAADAVAGQGGPRTETAKPTAGNPGERTALVLTHVVQDKGKTRHVSKTVEEFLKNRKEARAGTLQLFLVLNQD